MLLNIALYYLLIELTFNIFHFFLRQLRVKRGQAYSPRFPERLVELLKQTANINLRVEQKEFASLNRASKLSACLAVTACVSCGHLLIDRRDHLSDLYTCLCFQASEINEKTPTV